ncbi:MAG: hypothetical protein HYW03_01370 [Deltaproteobacteria bacterium]|nr:hypothetical protein [Deltaproteobacteria bacterium]
MNEARSVVLTQKARATLFFLSLAASCLVSTAAALALADKGRPALFLPEERRIIREYYQSGSTAGLPPGLAKRGGKLPPGLQKHLQKNGTLPPGLQKRLQPIPTDLDRRLQPIPEIWERVIIGRDVILLDRRTNRILDIIENVIGLITGQ